MTRIPHFDGMRAVSILLVVFGHFTQINAIPAALGVSVFFMISGYIIAAMLLREIDSKGGIDFAGFYRRRAYRLLPAILVSIAVAYAVQQHVGGVDWVTADRVLASVFFFQNYWVDVFPFTGPLGMHWSLAVEEHFYIIFPIVLLALWRFDGENAVSWLIMACFVALAFRYITYEAMMLDGYAEKIIQGTIYRSTHLRFDSILGGVILAIMAHRGAKFGSGLRVLVLGVALMIFLRAYQPFWFLQTFKFSVQTIALFLVMAAVLFGSRCGWCRWILSLPPVVFIGQISFSLYLLHTSVELLVTAYLPFEPHSLVLLPFTVPASILAAWVSFRFVETPIIRWGRRPSPPMQRLETSP